MFSECALVDHQPDGRALVRAVLVPRLWRLTQTHHSRIFTRQSMPDILKKTLEDGGLTGSDYSFQLSQSYPPEEHVCQYRESNFDFLSRWMEREGIYYWFEQGDDGERLIVADDKSTHEDLVPAPVRFLALSGADATARECLHSFVCRHRALPASVRFKDHDYTKPSLNASGTAPVSKTGHGEISVHGARFFTPDAGTRLARLRAEEMLAREQVFTGSGTAFYLRTGYTFSLQDHPRSSFDAKYLVTEVEHYGNQSASAPELQRLTGLGSDEVYRVDVTAIPVAIQFRAEARTPWPRIYGTEHGIVDGEAESEYAQLDEHGRYAVRFAFDESDLGDGRASTRVRMMQPHGGGVEGWHFPLRKGTEVLFTFLGGDPDRPVIAGVVPNALTPSPVTKSNHTRNVIQTGGRNRFELEDKAGFQRITLSTPHSNTMIRMGAPNADHNMIVSTDGDTLLDAGRSWDVTVGKNLTEYVTGKTEETYQGDHVTQSWSRRLIEIGGPYIQNCHNNVTRKVYGDAVTTIDGDATHKVGGDELHTVHGNQIHMVTGNEAHTVSGDEVHNVSGSVKQTFGATTAEYASLDWNIPGGATIKTPKMVINCPAYKVNSGSFWDTYGTKKSYAAFSFGGGVMKVDTTAVAMSAGGLKVENKGMKKGSYGFDFRMAAAMIKQDGFSIANAGAILRAAGFVKIG
jgi:type VI secretion system secreted protein VgrG